ncbi:MAG: efflux RND transporter permease subunit [Burkholderiaceae bacterium]
MSLFALIFSIGILVDDAIVVVENIHRHRALHPDKPLWQIVPGAVDEVGGPCILATLTVIAALLPVALVSGLMGPYMAPIRSMPRWACCCRWRCAFVVTPWLAIRFMKSGTVRRMASRSSARACVVSLAACWARSCRRPEWRRLAQVAALGSVAPGDGRIGVVGLQSVVLEDAAFDNKSEFQVVVDMPAGTPLEGVNAALIELAGALAGDPTVLDVQGYAGTAAPINFNGLVRQCDFGPMPSRATCR